MAKPKNMVTKIASAAHKDAPVVRVKHHGYQPSRAELREEIKLPAGTTPEQMAKALVTPVRVVEEK